MSSHSVRCADAVRTTRKQCKCMCDGVMHGGPHTERARALIWPLETRKKYSQRQVSNSKRVAREAVETSEAIGEVFTDLLVRYIVNELVHEQAPGDQDLARDTLKDPICPFVDEVMEAELDDSDSKELIQKGFRRLELAANPLAWFAPGSPDAQGFLFRFAKNPCLSRRFTPRLAADSVPSGRCIFASLR
ncbi:hypothetical protein A7979_10450 [Rothia nasimurium]|uniref:Uncharacterized protein n=1 Tax=Rothia nasimurium TaxID=85336 RepID=A0A1Y1RRS8_9MICC|nr:hypothetical protein [Rothia nasimurium]ORC24145.1 hypothetical protein A7979_10450 [Rothia nasimurium]